MTSILPRDFFKLESSQSQAEDQQSESEADAAADAEEDMKFPLILPAMLLLLLWRNGSRKSVVSKNLQLPKDFVKP